MRFEKNLIRFFTLMNEMQTSEFQFNTNGVVLSSLIYYASSAFVYKTPLIP